MEYVTIKELDINSKNKIYAYVLEIKNTFAKNGNPYQKIRIRDTNKDEMEITAWEGAMLDSKAITTPVIMSLEIYGNKDSVNEVGSVYYKLASSLFINGNKSDFLPESRIDRTAVKNELMNYIDTLESPLLKSIVVDAIKRNWTDFCTKALTNGLAYKTIGGIMEATYNLIKYLEPMVLIQGLNRDLALAGAMLYYIGATKTVDTNFCGTKEGVLIGIGELSFQEIVISVERLRARVGENEEWNNMLNSDLVCQLEHIVLARDKHAATLEAMTLKRLAKISEEAYVMQDMMEKTETGEIVALSKTNKYNTFYNNRT